MRSAKAASAAAKKRWERLDTYSMEKTMTGMTRADPRSGCFRIKRMGNPAARANFPRTFIDSRTVPISDRARMLADMINTPSFAASEG